MVEKAELTVPNRIESGETVSVEVEANSDVELPNIGTVEYDIAFFAADKKIGEKTGIERTAGQQTFESINWTPEGEARDIDVSVTVDITYDDGTSSLSDGRTVQLVESIGEDTVVVDTGTGNSSASSLNEFYANRTDFFIDGIVYDPDVPRTIIDRDNADTITFEYKNPSITVDSSARFVKHEIIGARTLRQKVGKDALEISVDGVCYRDTARRIDGLRYAETGTVRADRFDASSIDVQFASATTDPMEEGSAVDFTEVNELFNFSLEMTEVR